MNLHELIEKIEKVSKNYAEQFEINRDSDWFMFKLQEEIGELTQAYLMYSGRAREKGMSKKELKKAFESEVADVLCHILLLAQHNNISLEKRIHEKWLVRLKK